MPKLDIHILYNQHKCENKAFSFVNKRGAQAPHILKNDNILRSAIKV